LGYLLLRTAIAMLFWLVLAPANCLPRPRGMWLGLALNPLSGGSAMLLSMGTLMLGNPMNAAAASMMAVLLISELAGPWLCRLALQQAGDICKEQ
jgi:hypothetical protein